MKAVVVAALAVTALLAFYCAVSPNIAVSVARSGYSTEFVELVHAAKLDVRSPVDMDYRYSVFLQNKQYIAQANKRVRGYTLGVTLNALYTFEEFTHKFNLHTFGAATVAAPAKHTDTGNIGKDSVDWRGVLDKTPVRDQTPQCNAGYAMSVAGMMESFVQKYRQQAVPISAQQLIDCSVSYGNQGCRGGYADKALQFIAASGVATEHDYPYRAATQQCAAAQPFAGIRGYAFANSKQLVKSALKSMPMVVALEVNNDLMHYTGGVYSSSSCGGNLNHFMLAVGFSENYISSDYWILKNSFGARWGERGYLRLQIDSCGVSGNVFNVYLTV